MTNRLYGYIEQKESYKKYNAKPSCLSGDEKQCRMHDNGVRDWIFSYGPCKGKCVLGSNRCCSKVKPINFKGTPLEDAFITYGWFAPPIVRHEFDLDKINTKEQLDFYEHLFDTVTPNGQKELHKLYYHLCSKTTSECPSVSSTGDKMKECSSVNSTGELSTPCSSWYSQMNDTDKDAFIRSFCNKNQEAGDCSCFNRQLNDDYNNLVIALGTGQDDRCWYPPCKGDSPIFIASDNNKPKECPSTICQQVINADAGRDVKITDAQYKMVCGKVPGGSGNSGDGGDGGSGFLTKRNKMIAIAVLSIFVLLGISIRIYFILKNKNKK